MNGRQGHKERPPRFRVLCDPLILRHCGPLLIDCLPGSAPPPETCLYRLLGDNRVICPPLVLVQNLRVVLSDGFSALRFPVDCGGGNTDFFGNVRRAHVRLIQRGNLLLVRKRYIFILLPYLLPCFSYFFGQTKAKNKLD